MLSPTVWLKLSQETRSKIAKEFQLNKSGHSEVVDNQVVSDGYSVFDLQGITLEKLKAFTNNTSDDFYFQFTKVVNWFEPKLETSVVLDNKDIILKDNLKDTLSTNKKRYVKKNK